MKENDGLLPDDIKRAREILSDWCSNDGKKFRMCVPVQPDDSDEIMSRVIDAAEAALTASRPVVVGVAALKQEDLNNPYTDRSDNICYWSGWNDCIDDLLKRNFLAGAPVGGDRPAIPGLQEAIAVLREEISVMENIITLNLEGNNKKTRRKLEQWKALYEAARQSGVPDGWQPIETTPKEEGYYLFNLVQADQCEDAGKFCHVGIYLSHWDERCNGRPWVNHSSCYKATHWMPLPEAPNKETISGARDGRE